MPNWQALLDLAPYAIGMLAPPEQGAAFLQGYEGSKERLRKQKFQEQKAALAQQNIQQHQGIQELQLQRGLERDAAHAQASEQHGALERLRAFDVYGRQKGAQLGANADNALDAQNQMAVDLLGRSQAMGLPPSVMRGALPDMSAMISKGAKADAKAMLEAWSKQLSPEQRKKVSEDRSITFEWGSASPRLQNALQASGRQPGDAIKPSELRSVMGGGVAMNPKTGQPWQEAAPLGGAPGSMADFLTASPERRAEITAARKAYGSEGAATGSFADYMTATPARKAEIAAARGAYSAAGASGVMGGSGNDPKDIAQAIVRGEQPPDLKGLYRMGSPVRAELARLGYPLANAMTDWQATQKHFATLNGAQQTRLRQAADTAVHSLDVIDELSAQWKGGRYPLLNKANLALATNGAFGSDVASVAQQLQAQITDLTSELANVYMGGNSPTEQALKLASSNLSAAWSHKVLNDMVGLARKNLTIRQNAIKNVNVIGASPNNPYAPSAGSPTTESGAPIQEYIRVNGKLVRKGSQ